MTALRSAVRENLGLEWPKRADTSSSSPAPPVAATLEELEQKLMEAIVAVEQPPALACAAPVGSAELPMAVKTCTTASYPTIRSTSMPMISLQR